jgi:phosphopantothenoylcysteine decarboxylase/phosphopantothenate--cysteine ligase
MAEAVLTRLPDVDVLVMAAAVADWQPVAAASGKLKKASGPPGIHLEPTTDILATAGRHRREGQFIVGFAAETDDLLANAAGKLATKGADLIVANDALGAMDQEDNAVTVLGAEGTVASFGRQPKRQLASDLWDVFGSRMARA